MRPMIPDMVQDAGKVGVTLIGDIAVGIMNLKAVDAVEIMGIDGVAVVAEEAEVALGFELGEEDLIEM